jgi:transposase
VHLVCTRYLTCMHTGDRSAEAIDSGGVLPGYSGVIVRAGYAGYGHLTSALHAWCGVHLLRDLKSLYDFEPSQQEWASRMAALQIEARDAASAARTAGQSVLNATILDDLVTRYRALTAGGLAANLYRRSATAKDARRIARRFRAFEDPILRFATRPDLDNGLAEFAIVQSYLSTAAKWGISKLDALRSLFNGNAWLPPGLEPTGQHSNATTSHITSLTLAE